MKEKEATAKEQEGTPVRLKHVFTVTSEEKLAYSLEVVNLIRKRVELERQVVELKKLQKQKTDAVIFGRETREVEAIVVKNFGNGKVETWFRDMLLAQRDMTDKDRQIDLEEV
jgi:hypothetical protein